MTTKQPKKSGKKVNTLRAKSLTGKQAKRVKGGVERTVSTYTFINAWPSK